MSRFNIGVVVSTFLLVALIILLSGTASVSQPPMVSTPTASSTLSVVPDLTPLPLTLPTLDPIATTSLAQATSTVKKSVSPATKTAPTATTVVAPAPVATPPFDPAALDAAAATLRAALVNIICYAPAGSRLHSTSGSGVFIDDKGIILTNAHIAQYFLLTDRGVSCTIRSGSPAVDRYEASLIYISPLWLHTNASVLTQTNPNGTGEQDFAFLAITKSVTMLPLPSSFPSIPLAQVPPSIGTPVVIASYGAQFLETSQVQSSLFPTVVFGSIKDVFTFATNTIDVIALGGSVAAQEGSSGGGVTDSSGALVGTITTSTVEGATNTRSLSAITASYIRAEYASETGQALELLLVESTATAVANFAPKIPDLEAIITAQLY